MDLVVGIGRTKTLEHLDKTISSATTQLNSIIQEGGTNAKGYLALIKSLKDASVLIIKTASHLMDGLENLRTEKSKASTVFQKILTDLTKVMLQTDAALIRAFERFDNANKMMCK